MEFISSTRSNLIAFLFKKIVKIFKSTKLISQNFLATPMALIVNLDTCIEINENRFDDIEFEVNENSVACLNQHIKTAAHAMKTERWAKYFQTTADSIFLKPHQDLDSDTMIGKGYVSFFKKLTSIDGKNSISNFSEKESLEKNIVELATVLSNFDEKRSGQKIFVTNLKGLVGSNQKYGNTECSELANSIRRF